MTERDLFIAALQIDDPAERAAYLDQACGGDNELRNRLNVLLAAHHQPHSVVEKLIAVSVERAPMATEPDETAGSELRAIEVGQTASHHHDEAAPAALIGCVIAGRYKLREEIAEQVTVMRRPTAGGPGTERDRPAQVIASKVTGRKKRVSG